MSSMDKMAIQGIRSFGPRDQDTQVIQFFSPVTLIVGANGTGKCCDKNYQISLNY